MKIKNCEEVSTEDGAMLAGAEDRQKSHRGERIVELTSGKLLDEKEAAQSLHCSVAFLRRRRLFRATPVFIKVGRLVRYCTTDLDAFVSANAKDCAA
jgi:hypothetical protein